MAPKNDYAIVLSCNPGYGFGMIASMNAQKYFGTRADWAIAYEHDLTGSPDYYQLKDRVAISETFNAYWHEMKSLMAEIIDRRSDQSVPLEKYWLSYWLLARKLLREKRYKAVCVIQADAFVFTNLNRYFKIAEAGVFVTSEFPFSYINAEDLPFGDDRAIWDRSQAGIFDAVNFLGPEHLPMLDDIINFQCEDPFKGEASHSVISLNRAACKHLTRDKILGLNRSLWVGDHIWSNTKLHIGSDGHSVFNDREIQLRAWHCRWWQKGRVEGEWRNGKDSILKRSANADFIKDLEIQEHNFTLVRDFMLKFNNMIPRTASSEYHTGVMTRPRWENEVDGTDHYTVVNNLLRKHFGDRPISGIEIGTGPGVLTLSILTNVDNVKHLYTIDPWKHKDGGEYEAWFPQEVLDVSRRTAYERVKPFKERATILPIESDAAIKQLGKNKYDFVWVDGDHTLDQVQRDLENYYPLVKKGGIFGGHDYNTVYPVVDKFFGAKGLHIHKGADLTFWVYV